MNKSMPLIVAGIIFSFVTLFHVLRYYYHWDIIIAGHLIPMWTSCVLVLPGILAVWMFMAAFKK